MMRATTRRHFKVLLPLLVVISVHVGWLGAPGLGAPFEPDDPIPNPDLEVSCGLDVLLVLDESGSISQSRATEDVRSAFLAFVSALRNTGSRVAALEFSQQARPAIDEYTVVTDATIVSTFEPYIRNDYNPNGLTNWEDAMRAARYFLPRPTTAVPHLVVFITDGDPTAAVDWQDTTYDPGNPNVAQNEYELKFPLDSNETVSIDLNPGTDRAVSNANAVKGDGSHILVIGVGEALQNPSSMDRLTRITGTDIYDGAGTFDIADDDIFAVADFSDLSDALRQAAFDLCSPSVTVQKLIDLTPDPDTDDAFPGQGWDITATVGAEGGFDWVLPPGASGSTATRQTDGAGFATFQWTTNQEVSSTASFVEEDPVTGPVPDLEYDPSATQCTYRTPDFDDDRPLDHTTTALGFDLVVPTNSIVTCSIVNRAPAEPAISLEKRTNGTDADDPPDDVPVPGNNVPVLQEGEAVTWTYEVTNDGNVTLDIAVTDDPTQTVTCPSTTLAPGDTVTCTAAGTAVDTTAFPDGYYANTATVVGTDPFGATVDDTDPSHYIGVAPADLTIEKSTETPSGGSFDADMVPGPLVPVGGDVSWSYVVTNTSTTSTLENLVVIDPTLGDAGGAVDCGGTTVLGPEASVTCVSDQAFPAEAGLYENLAIAVANTEGLPADLHVDSDPSHYFGTTSGITLEKWTNGADADDPDPAVNPVPQIPVASPVLWTYIVNNTGNLPVINVSVTDDQDVTVVCPRNRIPAGGRLICLAGGTSESTVSTPGGVYANVGSVSGTTLTETQGDGSTPPVPVTDSDPSHYIGVEPGIDLEKATNGVDADIPSGPFLAPGDPVAWTYVVTNTGNLDLARVGVVDPWLGLGGVSCPATELAAGAQMTCTASGTAEEGQYRNGAFAIGATENPQLVFSADPSHYFGATGTINIEKWTKGVDADTPAEAPYIESGEDFTWAFLVRNEANTAMSEIAVTDDRLGDVDCPQATLAPGELMVCLVDGVAESGLHENVASVTGTAVDGTTHTDTDPSHYIGYQPGIDVQKSTNGVDADTAPGVQVATGQPVVWRYTVTTNGLPVSNVELVDTDASVTPVYVSGDDDGDGVLELGEAWIYEAEATATAGDYVNVATAQGYDVLQEQPVEDSDPSHYTASGTDPVTPPLPLTGSDLAVMATIGLILLSVGLLVVRSDQPDVVIGDERETD